LKEKEKEKEKVECTKQKNENEIRFEKFRNWIDEFCPDVNKMRYPFTQLQFEQIIVDRKLNPNDKDDIGMFILRNMHNRIGLLKEYKSAYSTFLSWYRLEMKRKNGK
jgi:hypothetical protein